MNPRLGRIKNSLKEDCICSPTPGSQMAGGALFLHPTLDGRPPPENPTSKHPGTEPHWRHHGERRMEVGYTFGREAKPRADSTPAGIWGARQLPEKDGLVPGGKFPWMVRHYLQLACPLGNSSHLYMLVPEIRRGVDVTGGDPGRTRYLGRVGRAMTGNHVAQRAGAGSRHAGGQVGRAAIKLIRNSRP